MKIDSAIRSSFAQQVPINQIIKKEVDSYRTRLDPAWHYVSRLKEEESFAQKIEAGRCKTGMLIDDFFACTVVVRNSTEIPRATKILTDLFDLDHRRPADAAETNCRPADFRFNDLRLYMRIKPGYLGSQPINNVVFEVQVKTFLQHAWAVATHDLTYKTDSVRWSRLRVAFQIRAMLEHAELSIERFESLSVSEIIDKEYLEYAEISEIIELVREKWPDAALPVDLQRLAQSVRNASNLLGVSVDQIKSYIHDETLEGRGAATLDLSPFGAIIESILMRHPIDVSKTRLRKNSKIMISASVRIPGPLRGLVGNVIEVY